MNDREKFEAWADKYAMQLSYDAVNQNYTYSQTHMAFQGWQACAESKQSELDKANARIAQLEEALNELKSKLCGEWLEIADNALGGSSDTWLSEHDKVVEVRLLEKLMHNNKVHPTSALQDIELMIESRK